MKTAAMASEGKESKSSLYSVEDYLSKVQFYTDALVVCLSTNGERALSYTIVKLLITTNIQTTKIKSELLNYAYAVKGIQCHSNCSPQLFEFKKKQQNQVTLLKNFFVIFLIVVVTHNTFTQLNIPMQDLPSMFV